MRCYALVVSLGLLAGCGPRAAVSPTPEQANFDAVWTTSVEVLREYQFRIDRIDRRAGMITTFPMTGKSWTEPWRKDGATARDTLESTLQTIYRTATVYILRGDAGGYRPEVRIAVARSNRPRQQVTDTSEAYALFIAPGGRKGWSDPSAEDRPAAARTSLPDDPKLAEQIQSRILRRLAGE